MRGVSKMDATTFAHPGIVEAVAARCRAVGISPARAAMARMAASLITFHRDNVIQDTSYGFVTSWEALMVETAAEIDQAMAAWEKALRDGYIAQHVYILMFLALDRREYRERLLIDEHPRVEAWHQQLATSARRSCMRADIRHRTTRPWRGVPCRRTGSPSSGHAWHPPGRTP